MKTPSNELQELIKSLLPGERKGFITYSRGKKDSDSTEYLRLFNIYCEEGLIDDYEVKRNHLFKNFTRIKNYLHQQLLY